MQMACFSSSTFSQSSRRPTMMVHTGPMDRMSRPSFSRRARPRSTASATAIAWGKATGSFTLRQTAFHRLGHGDCLGQGEGDRRVDADAAIGGLFHGRNAGPRRRNLHNHVGCKLAEPNGLLHDSPLVPVEPRIRLYGKAAVTASLRVENRLQKPGPLDRHLLPDLPADLILGGRGH